MYAIVENCVSYTIKTVGVIPLLQANKFKLLTWIKIYYHNFEAIGLI